MLWGLVTPRLTSGVKNQTQDININFAVFISYVSLVSGTHLQIWNSVTLKLHYHASSKMFDLREWKGCRNSYHTLWGYSLITLKQYYMFHKIISRKQQQVRWHYVQPSNIDVNFWKLRYHDVFVRVQRKIYFSVSS